MYFEMDGWKYGLAIAQPGTLRNSLRFVTGMLSDVSDGEAPFVERFVVLCWDRPSLAVNEKYLEETVRGSVVILDRSHLEAALAGLGDLVDFIRETFRRSTPYVPLEGLLASRASQAVPLSMGPARSIALPELGAPKSVDVRVDLVLVGEPGTDIKPGGLAYEGPERLLVTCDGGVIELNPSSGSTRWKFQLPGCYGTPLPHEDGSVFVLCGPALMKWNSGRLTVVAGPFEPPARLLQGPDGQAWVLSGSGVTFGNGEGTLALTRAGETLGDQLRYPLAFDAAVRSAASLDARRFLLAADGHSATVDLKRGTGAGVREDWIPTPVPHPHHILPTGPDHVAVASEDGSGIRVLVRSLNLLTGAADGAAADVALGRLHGMAQAPAGPAYLLGTLPGSVPHRALPALVRLTGFTPAPSTLGPEPAAPRPSTLDELYDAVGLAARGNEKDYRIDDVPHETGGQAKVYRAVHKATGAPVAFKRRNKPGQGAVRRWRRELECARQMGTHPAAMPILDADAQARWFVMPYAEATAEQRRADLLQPENLFALVSSVASALAAAHQKGWVHRDITPPNILLFDGRWRLADWGIARRPRGQTSAGGRLTEVGVAFGTEGFAAPELARDANELASPASDIYSLGRLIGWVLTGDTPQPNVPLLPLSGPWRQVVRSCTRPDPGQRPQSIPDFLDLVQRATATVDELPIFRAEHLVEAAHSGDLGAVADLIDLIAERPHDYELHIHALVQLDPTLAGPALNKNTIQAAEVLHALGTHTSDDQGTWPEFHEQDRVILWLWRIAQYAANDSAWELLEAAVDSLFTWEGRFDQWTPRDAIQPWLAQLTGHAASMVASVLREHPSSARHFRKLADDRMADRAIRSAVYAASL
ncbi:protein kinase [Streptomyces sp. NPDC059096]|uniref:protein kinase domain-containing protein n=1 Tax=Streptomyces sp. NPDC059096 TaxID=3346727 RepID=UPI0036757867